MKFRGMVLHEERRVDVLSSDAWIVWLDLDLIRSVKALTVKQTTIRYPVRVVSQAIDPESNPGVSLPMGTPVTARVD